MKEFDEKFGKAMDSGRVRLDKMVLVETYAAEKERKQEKGLSVKKSK